MKKNIHSIVFLKYLLIYFFVGYIYIIGLGSSIYMQDSTVNLNQVKSATGISEIYFPPCSFEQRQNNLCLNKDPIDPNIIELLNPSTGVFTFRWKENIVGKPEKSEQDRYEISFNENIPHIYGIGNDLASGGVQIDDFQDNNFANGQLFREDYGQINNPDAVMARTPILVLPSKNLIILYIQDEVKQLRLSRTDASTTIVMSKKKDLSQFNAGTLVIAQGSNLKEAFSNYYTYLNKVGYFFKKPHWKAFGINWEIYGETGTYANMNKIINAVNQYRNNGFPMDTLTIGSNFWTYKYGFRGSPNYNTKKSCFDSFNFPCGSPSMEVFEPEDNANFKMRDLYNLIPSNIYVLLGMRHNSRAEFALEFINKMKNLNNSLSLSEIFINGDSTTYYYGHDMGDISIPINTSNVNVMTTYINGMIKAYGNFKGIKEDEMLFYDQVKGRDYHLEPNGYYKISANLLPIFGLNIPESYFFRVFSHWNNYYNNDWVSMASSNYIGFGTDAQEANNYVVNKINLYGLSQKDIDNLGKDMNITKFSLDKMLQHVMAGYPHSNLLKNYPFAYFNGINYVKMPEDRSNEAFCTITNVLERNATEIERQAKIYLRNWQWATFTPVVWQSCGFWHLYQDGKGGINTDEIVDYYTNIQLDRDINETLLKQYRDSAIWYNIFRKRLHQYAYDMAQEWYQTGVPTLMQPLFFNEAWKNDPNVQKMYETCRPDETCYPTDGRIVQGEYMFGNALLVRPIMTTKDVNDINTPVYLPKGQWVSLIKPMPIFNSMGGTSGYYNFTPDNINQYPVFLKEGEILLIGKQDNPENLQAYVFLGNNFNQSNVYRMHDRSYDPSVKKYTRFQAIKMGSQIYLKNLDNGKMIEMNPDIFNKGYLIADIDYLINDASTPIPPNPRISFYKGWNKKNIISSLEEENLFPENCKLYSFIQTRNIKWVGAKEQYSIPKNTPESFWVKCE